MTAVVLKLYCREEPAASFDAAPEGTVDRLEDHDVVIRICKSADGIGDSQNDSGELQDLIARNLPIETSAHPAYDGIIVCLVCFRITVDAF